MDREKLLRELRIVAGIGLIAVLTFQAIQLPEVAKRGLKPPLDALSSTLGNVNKTTLTMNDLASMVSKDYYDPDNPADGFYTEIRSDLAESRKASKEMNSTLVDLHVGLTGDKGLLPTANLLLVSLTGAVDGLKKDTDKITDQFGDVLGPLAGTMRNIQTLSQELSDELKTGGNVDKTFVALAQAVADLDTQIKDPSIAKILANSAKTTGSIAETAESLDEVTRPWRKKVGQLQMILKTLASFLKVTVPLPF